jgi:phage protein D
MSDTALLSHFFLKLNGQDAPPELMRDLGDVTVENSLHLPDAATLALHDTRLRWIDDARLAPGAAIEISAKIGRSQQTIFDGEIVELEPDFSGASQRLTVRAFDRLHRLARGRRARSFQNVTDSDLANRIAGEVGLQAKVDATSQVYPYVFQANQTNLDFLQGRASALGYLLYVEAKTLHFVAPKPESQPIALKWGETLAAFRPRLTTVDQASSVMVRGWDPAQRQEIVGQTKQGQGAPELQRPQQGGSVAQDAFKMETQHLIADRPIRSQSEADLLAQSIADQQAGRFIEADGTCAGDPALKAGTIVEISSVGERFSGKYFVTSATHIYGGGGYHTEFTISGLHPATLLNLLKPEPEDLIARGLVIGIVTDNQDPDGLGRVKVKYPWLAPDHASDWARVAATGGGPSRGIEFLPEINDEVLVGFELGDIHYPYIVGGLWNGKDAPPKKNSQVISSGKVQQRIIRSRIGHVITIDDSDDKGFISIETAAGHLIKLSDADKRIEIKTDKNNVKLDDQGNLLALETQGDLTLKATGKVSIEGQQGDEMRSSTTMNLEAQATMNLQANATMDVKSNAILTIQGSLVKIN